jgi:hypothetical protein
MSAPTLTCTDTVCCFAVYTHREEGHIKLKVRRHNIVQDSMDAIESIEAADMHKTFKYVYYTALCSAVPCAILSLTSQCNVFFEYVGRDVFRCFIALCGRYVCLSKCRLVHYTALPLRA